MADDSKEDKLGTEVGNREKRSWTRKPVPRGLAGVIARCADEGVVWWCTTLNPLLVHPH